MFLYSKRNSGRESFWTIPPDYIHKLAFTAPRSEPPGNAVNESNSTLFIALCCRSYFAAFKLFFFYSVPVPNEYFYAYWFWRSIDQFCGVAELFFCSVTLPLPPKSPLFFFKKNTTKFSSRHLTRIHQRYDRQ